MLKGVVGSYFGMPLSACEIEVIEFSTLAMQGVAKSYSNFK